jgi:PKD repeat protein
MKLLTRIIVSGFFLACLVSFQHCEKKSLPSVTTSSISGITYINANSGGIVTNNGGAEVTSRGICWDSTQSPTIACVKTSDGAGNGAFSSKLAGLKASTTYYVRAYATNSEGTSYGEQVSFTTLIKPPEAEFKADKVRIPAGGNIQFSDLSANSPSTWLWNFGDAVTSNEKNPSHVYSSEGTYTVSLTVTNISGSNTKTKDNYITVDPATIAPVADFTSSQTIVLVGQAVQFTDQSANKPSSWTWDFGDGSSSALRNPSHAYANAGKYTVSLTSSNASGSDTETKTDYISAGIPPSAGFTVSQANPKVNQSVRFTDQSTNNPVRWSWDFGDGQTSELQNPDHAYATIAKFTVSLTVTNIFGSSTETKKDYLDIQPPAPVADFIASPTSLFEGGTVQFTDRSLNNPTSWNWNFDDASEDTRQNPVHAYSNIGIYNPSLTVSNRSGTDTRKRTNYIIVSRRFEAETADTIKTGTIDSNDPGFTGTGFVNFENKQGTYAVWKINLKGGHFFIEVRYANGSTDRAMDVYVNNVLRINNLTFPSTGSWTTWTQLTFPLDLSTGDNWLKMVGDNPESGPSLDNFIVRPNAGK